MYIFGATNAAVCILKASFYNICLLTRDALRRLPEPKNIFFMMISFKNGYPEVVLSEKFDALLFIKMIDGLRNRLGLIFKNQVKHKESICWLFEYSGSTLVILGDLFQGISICPCTFVNYTLADESSILQLAGKMEKWNELQDAPVVNMPG